MLGAVLAVCVATVAAAPKDKRETRLRRLPPPDFSVPGGVYTNAVNLTLTSPFGVVRHTVDGTEPTEGSGIWSSALTLTNSTLVRARVFEPGIAASAILSQAYILLDEELGDFTSNLPLVIIHSLGKEIEHETKIVVTARFIGVNPGRSSLLGPADFDGRGLLNIRGRGSLRYPKRSYTFKTLDEADNMLNVSLLGLPRESDWILYAPFPDKTLMRDVLAYELSNRMGQWAPRTVFVEVFVNESGGKLRRADYLGVYALEEKVKRDAQRVNIQKLSAEESVNVNGGYIFKKDHTDGGGFMGPMDMGGFPQGMGPSSSNRRGFPTGPGGFPADPAGFLPPYEGRSSSSSSSSSRSSRSRRGLVVTNRLGTPWRRDLPYLSREVMYVDDDNEYIVGSGSEEEGFRTSVATNHFYYVEPEPDEITAVQRAWLRRHVNEFESALYGPDFRDPAKGYSAFIDPISWIDHHLLVELTKNVDGFRFSTFFHKDRGGKIKMGPLWDWNLSFGNANGKQGWIPEHWLWPQLDDREYSYFRRLFEDPDFGQMYVDRWAELRTNLLATARVLARVEEIAALLQEAQARNFEKWPILGRNVHPNWFVGSSYDEEVQWMKNFILTRLAWMEKQFLPSPALQSRDGKVSLAASLGKIYYTLDGTDPRAPGGAVSSQAKLYAAPLDFGRGARLFARVHQDNRWSGPTVVGSNPR